MDKSACGSSDTERCVAHTLVTQPSNSNLHGVFEPSSRLFPSKQEVFYLFCHAAGATESRPSSSLARFIDEEGGARMANHRVYQLSQTRQSDRIPSSERYLDWIRMTLTMRSSVLIEGSSDYIQTFQPVRFGLSNWRVMFASLSKTAF
jgi:hypothetical protein